MTYRFFFGCKNRTDKQPLKQKYAHVTFFISYFIDLQLYISKMKY